MCDAGNSRLRLSENSLVADVFFSRLGGATQPALIGTSDRQLFVVKCKDFARGYSLLGEVVGAELMSLMGLPVPKWAPIYVSSTFITANPDLWYCSSGGHRRPPTAGLHFGSRLTLSEHERPTFQRVPTKRIGDIRNRLDFVGALLLDLWTNNCDRRQCLFLTEADGTLRAVFIDNDHMFGGDIVDDVTCPRRAITPDPRLYAGIWTDAVIAHWRERIDRINDDCLDQIFSRVPAEWAKASEIQAVRIQLNHRRRRLDCLIVEATRMFKVLNLLPNQTYRDALEPPIDTVWSAKLD